MSQTSRYQNGNHCQHQNFRSKFSFGVHGIESISFEDFFLHIDFGVHGIDSVPFSFFSIEDLTDLSVLRILKRLTFSHRYIPEKNWNGFGKFMNSAIELQIKYFSGLLELIEKSSLSLSKVFEFFPLCSKMFDQFLWHPVKSPES